MTLNRPLELSYDYIAVHFDVSFWFKLQELKLKVWKLNEDDINIYLTLPDIKLHTSDNQITLGILNEKSFNEPDNEYNSVRGILRNFNTFEKLVESNKKLLLKNSMNSMLSSSILDTNSTSDMGNRSIMMQSFILYTFVDLKKHIFHYILAFPTIKMEPKPLLSSFDFFTLNINNGEVASSKSMDKLHHVYTSLDHYCKCNGLYSLNEPLLVQTKDDLDSLACILPLTIDHLCEYVKNSRNITMYCPNFIQSKMDQTLPVYVENLISLCRIYTSNIAFTMTLFMLRPDMHGLHEYNIAVPASNWVKLASKQPIEDILNNSKVTGWVSKKIHSINLQPLLSVESIANQSAMLNVELMKWRMLPELDLSKLKSLKALLIGSGTLGCHISRQLLMWGVRSITLVDRGTVSVSNPVRQTLFTHADTTAAYPGCIKSIAAAHNLGQILPGVNAIGVELNIRMPGHAVQPEDVENCTRDVNKLEELIQSHDIVFLLTDSREARWLPTLLCTVHKVPAITTALGFHSWLVMRHGIPGQNAQRLGCYFCNDVVAPVDSMTARTIDQQCTVTRPGVSGIASAVAVELLASLLNHPDQFNAPTHKHNEEVVTALGCIPHQIRGCVAEFTTSKLTGTAYSKCVACSDNVVNAFRTNRMDFIIKCLNDPQYIEEISGIAEERKECLEMYPDWDAVSFSDE